ncbi:hypothetical protein N7457_003729 [Penicillium paradoxum]|uniref:uncharacterized protein n=1 Tax=Penicillium paradoxum TaxID=176176 RepID=UPI0025494CCD|nr:uncharacterized protein N7457_003729 [Penicillium paradoxum]KAJ5788739.1 hypothetical protein N7457_003729 [Penicillium paradoxum]
MPSRKKKPQSSRKRDNDADQAELEALRKKVAEAEEARMQAEAQAKPSSRRQRQLVRWDVDTDIRLLLAVQYVCNKQGVKIPWKEVAETMGPKFTEGAVVQHLSKLRIKREEQDKPNPPPLKRAGNSSYKKDANQNESVPPQKETSKSQPRSTKRRRGTSEYSSDDVYTLKKKYAERMKQQKTSATAKRQAKRAGTNTDGTTNMLCVDAPWLQDFHGGNPRDDEEDSELSDIEWNENSTESSQATTQDSKKSKIVKLKMDAERLADVDRQIGAAASRDGIVPMDMSYAGTSLPLNPSLFYPYMYPPPPPAFSPVPYANYPGTSNSGLAIPYPSSGPSPFDYVNRAPTPLSDSTFEAKREEVSGVTDGYNQLDASTTYPHLNMPGMFQGHIVGRDVPTSYGGNNEFNRLFAPESHELFVPASDFAGLEDVERPRYFGYDGEETKEF